MLPTLAITHSAWAGPLLLVADAVDHDLPIESGTVTFVADPGLQFGTFNGDDGGRLSMSVALGNEDAYLDAWFGPLKGLSEKPQATLRWFDDDEVTLLLGPITVFVHEPTPSGAGVKAELRSPSDEDLPAQPEAFTMENTPTLRGLRT